ncbi:MULTISPECIES: AMP-binding protein [unclassified Leptolyngbya]|uniref:AMP-binding protein n=1 Tax=unclassified Leptolyngbya TaxID=2650499 RepID=UPI00168518B9|nr:MULTISPECIES: AMP-binding protein [unclassified Leptolyngbya]MBD1910802.1 AMP-binding protein [Leptolyngbya sp. FACHB-8]MBD2157628.1 AMP-binding protein [Leptolyngbya sp. FACHB-16]
MSGITDSFVAHAQRYPNQLAIACGSQSLTYGELLHRVQQVARVTATYKAQHSTHPDHGFWVGILLSNRVEFLELFLGITMAGGVAMVLNPEWASPQLQSILDRWTPGILVSDSQQLQRIENLSSLKAIALDILPADPSSYENWLDPESASLENQLTVQEDFLELAIDPDSPFYIGFTSGTTGHPKGILRSHASWLNSFAASRIEFDIGPTDQVLVPGSLVHSLSLYTAIEALNMGASLHILPHFTPKAILLSLNQPSITRLVAVPTVLKTVANTAQSLSFSHLKTVIAGGSKLSPALRDQLATVFPQADILEYYGASELSFVSIASSRERIPSESVGRAFHGVTLSVQRDDGSGMAKVGEIGWIGIRSNMLCSGYLEPQPSTGFRIEQGWATVGDRGYLDENGFLYLVGREHDMLISNGINVYPSEIEAVLLQLPEIENAVILGIPDDCRGDLICAIITWNGPKHLTRNTLIHHIRTQIGQAKCPRRFFAVKTLPTTTSGKPLRSHLQAQILQGHLSPQELRT